MIEPLEEPTQAIMLHMEREGLSGLTTICNPLNISRTHLAKKTAILTSDRGSERLDRRAVNLLTVRCPARGTDLLVQAAVAHESKNIIVRVNDGEV